MKHIYLTTTMYLKSYLLVLWICDTRHLTLIITFEKKKYPNQSRVESNCLYSLHDLRARGSFKVISCPRCRPYCLWALLSQATIWYILNSTPHQPSPVCKQRSQFKSLWSSDAIWWHRSRTLAEVMAWCLTAPSHYLSQCWLTSGIHLRAIPQKVFMGFIHNICLNISFKTTTTYPGGQWVKVPSSLI